MSKPNRIKIRFNKGDIIKYYDHLFHILSSNFSPMPNLIRYRALFLGTGERTFFSLPLLWSDDARCNLQIISHKDSKKLPKKQKNKF